MTEAEALRMTLSDVASLAQVQRPVVSMWRKRSAASAHPFPAPAALAGGRELFDADQVGAWLEATGRGNNTEARNDAAAFAAPAAQGQRETFNALTSLLALKVLTGRQLAPLGSDQLLDVADECDPDDRLLYAELEALKDELPALAGYADRLTDSAYSATAAFEGLLADRFRAGLREHADTALTAPALSLVAAAATALAATLDGRPLFVDPTAGGGDLLVAILQAHTDAAHVPVLTTDDDGAAARLLRRRLAVHGADTGLVSIEGEDGLSVSGPAVHAAQYPSPGNPGATAEDILAGIEDVVLQMDDAQRAVIIAPARLLSAPLTGTAGNLRGDLLRSGRVRAIVQLPPGLLKAKPRELQALWILGPSFAEVPIVDRWTMVADLSTRQLTQDVSQDLVSDVVAAMGNRWTLRAHSFRFARLIPTRTLLAGKGCLVAAAAPTATRVRASAETALRIDELLRPGNVGYTEAGLMVQPVEAPAATRTTKVEELLRGGNLRYIQGNRVPDSAATKPEGIRLLGPGDLLNPYAAPPRYIELLAFAANNPSGRLTEPGDVVFCTSPRPAALVDHDGGSAAVFPARVLRIDGGDPGGLLADVVAADINALGAADKSWRHWRLRRVPDAQRRRLAESLARLQHGQDLARERLKRLEELATLITDGVAGGSLTLTDPSTKLAEPQTEGTR
ncbi:hypothetical protein [uncultured Arthrobacter sp.]|uniref:hypothetical protein n=1 Tax=uncultured Arthrobacter sp. TaxID=114050 RepID=UPI0032179802